MNRLTDKAAIKLALLLAIDVETSLIDSYRGYFDKMESEPGVILARRNIAAFQRVLDRYYGGAKPRKLPAGEPVSIWKLMNAPDRTFDPDAA